MIKQLKLNKTRLNTFVLNINTSLLNTLTLHLLYCYKLRLNKTDNISHVEEIKFSQPLVSRKKSKHELLYYLWMNGIVEVFARWNGMELIENRITFYLYCSISAPAPPSGLNAPFLSIG